LPAETVENWENIMYRSRMSQTQVKSAIYLSMALQPLWPLAAFFFQFLNIYKFGRSPWTGDQPVARPLPTHRTTQTFTPWV
jgi:hypothetical protein